MKSYIYMIDFDMMRYVRMVREIEISVEVYNLLEQARLPGEDFSDTLLRLVRKYEQTEFVKRQKQILEEEDFLLLDESEE